MTIEKFKEKYNDLINRGVIIIYYPNKYSDHLFISVDRFNDETNEFIATKNEVSPVRADLRKMGFIKTLYDVGTYKKPI